MKEGRAEVDVAFDFSSETPPGRDPDAASPTLRRYHRLLWSRPLQSGDRIELASTEPARECYLRDLVSGLCFGSDAITHTYRTWTRPRALAGAVAALDGQQRQRYLSDRYTIASAMIWPVRFADKPTINQARGTRTRIADRIDLTLECVRRHYEGRGDSPLADVLRAYGDFFARFEGFEEFVAFFLLQDLLAEDGRVRFFLPLDGFDRHGAPRSVEEYVACQEAMLAFIDARSARIQAWAASR